MQNAESWFVVLNGRQTDIHRKDSAQSRQFTIACNVDEDRASLMAAAPELLEALTYYVSQHESHLAGIPEKNPNDGKVWDRTLALARAAIAKSKGGKS